MSNEQPQVICPFCNNPTEWPAYCPTCKNYFEAPPVVNSVSDVPLAPKTRGIGGWLILPAIGLIVNPFLLAGLLLLNISMLNGSFGRLLAQGTPGLRPAIVGQSITLLVLLGLQLYAGILFFTKSARLPTMMVVLLSVNVLFTIINVAWTASVLQEFAGARDLVQSIIVAGIWIPYFRISKRVEETFINRRPRTDNIAGAVLAGITALLIVVAITLTAIPEVPAIPRIPTANSERAKLAEPTVATPGIGKYEKNGFRFSHHSNWKITGDKMIEGKARKVDIENDDNAIFVILIFPPESSMGFGDFAGQMAEARPASIPGGNVSQTNAFGISRIVAGKSLEGVRHRYTVSLLRQTIPYTQDFFQIRTEKANILVTIQAPDEEWEGADRGFEVILDSLRFLSP
jgi:hypothetical protein